MSKSFLVVSLLVGFLLVLQSCSCTKVRQRQSTNLPSLWYPQISIYNISITKFNTKDLGEKELCTLLWTIGNDDGTTDKVTGPECGPCGPIQKDLRVDINDILVEKDPVETRLLTPAKLPSNKVDLPKNYNQKVYKTWASTKLAKKHARISKKLEKGMDKRVFYPQHDLLVPSPQPMDPLNFWRVNELPDINDHNRFPWSAIVRIGTIDRAGKVVHCSGAVVGQSTVLTAPQCVEGASQPPVIFTGYKSGSFEHVFLADQLWIPNRYNSCQPCSWTTFAELSDAGTVNVPFPSQGSYALLHIAPRFFKRNFFFDIGSQTGTLGLGAIYLPDLATLPGFDLRRAHGDQLNILNANVELAFNQGGILEPDNHNGPGFYDDIFNVQGDFQARGAPAVVNLGSAHIEDTANINPLYWFKMRNIVSGVVSCMTSDGPVQNVTSVSGAMFGMDFVQFFYMYCDRGCEEDCYIDHACGNGKIDDPTRWHGPFCVPEPKGSSSVWEDYYPPWWMPEQCDEGIFLNSERPNSYCRVDCQLAKCGDGIVDNKPINGRAPEECDDGPLNGTPDDNCNINCQKVIRFEPVKANNDTDTVYPCQSVGVDILTNDTPFANLDPNNVTIILSPDHGKVVWDPTQLVANYTADCGYAGNDTFTYRVCGLNNTESAGSCSTAQVTITVLYEANPDYAEKLQSLLSAPPIDRMVNISVLDNDSAPSYVYIPPTGLYVVPGFGPTNGQLTGDANGVMHYTPNPTFSGDDFFRYQACTDAAATNCGEANVRIRITILAISQYYEVEQGPAFLPGINPLVPLPDQYSAYLADPVDNPLHFPNLSAENLPVPSGQISYVISSFRIISGDFGSLSNTTLEDGTITFFPATSTVNFVNYTYEICAQVQSQYPPDCNTANITIFVVFVPGVVSYAIQFSQPSISSPLTVDIRSFNQHNDANYTSIVVAPQDLTLYPVAYYSLFQYYPVYIDGSKDPAIKIGEGLYIPPIADNVNRQQNVLSLTYTICANPYPNPWDNCASAGISIGLNSLAPGEIRREA